MEFGKFVTLVADAIGTVLDIFLQSAFSYLTDIAVVYVWTMSPHASNAAYVFRLHLVPKRLGPFLCNSFPHFIIILLGSDQ